ncbi:MAG TPA: TonB-dependent receptor [Allosphingosinicella sp.]|jgi:iron complex outermembrane receptor protein
MNQNEPARLEGPRTLVRAAALALMLAAAGTAARAAASAAQPPAAGPTPQAVPVPPTAAGRASENVVTQAEDAFGTSIGRETIGLYSAGNVRGFSAISAGNTRIDTLYFDQVQGPNPRIRRSTNIRVGLSALGFPFPAPTGIVDYALKSPGREPAASAYLYQDSWGGAALELDAVLPLGGRLSLGAGAGLYKTEFGDGTDTEQHVEAATLRWTPSPGVDVQPFWQRSQVYDDVGPIFVPAGPYLPPKMERRRFMGPKWAEHEGVSLLYGAKGVVAAGPRTLVRIGLFRSALDDRIGAANLYNAVTRDGQAQHVVLIDPPGTFASNSGELRATHRRQEGGRVHLLHASLRGRDRRRTYGGSDRFDLGTVRIGAEAPAPQPAFEFGEQSRDRVRQWTAGLAYEGRWERVGELSLGLQKTDYRKRVRLPGAAEATTGSRPWLFNATVALHASAGLAFYAGYVRGLEESGVAPANAANRNEPLPAIRTSQRDAGLRWAIRPDLRFVAGLFEVRKPYFQLDETSRFELLGDVRSRGLELSLAGKLTRELVVVAGAVLLDPRVTGEGVRLGRVGKRPVGLAERTLRLNLDWRPAFARRLSLDLGIAYNSNRPSTRDNRVFVPQRALLDLGARYRLRQGARPLTLRLSATNLLDAYALDVLSSGTYYTIPGRLVALSLASDF